MVERTDRDGTSQMFSADHRSRLSLHVEKSSAPTRMIAITR
jgi:hypothetical protein